jgi:hypothetical protein
MARKRRKRSCTCPVNPKIKCYRVKCIADCPELVKAKQKNLDTYANWR